MKIRQMIFKNVDNITNSLRQREWNWVLMRDRGRERVRESEIDSRQNKSEKFLPTDNFISDNVMWGRNANVDQKEIKEDKEIQPLQVHQVLTIYNPIYISLSNA